MTAPLVFIVVVVYVAGDFRGEFKSQAFYNWEKNNSESATVMDGSVLEGQTR